MALTVSRKQRLRTLENQIRKNAEAIQKNGLQIGRDLIEIRDAELWSDEFDSFTSYLKANAEALVGKSWNRSTELVQAAEIEKRIPANFRSDVRSEISI